MKSLRLLLWEECNRSCKGCCNKDWDLTKLPICSDFNGYDEIILTGGEPMLHPHDVYGAIIHIRHQTKTPIYLYTAKTDPAVDLVEMLDMVNGITVTLHTQKDVEPFLHFNEQLSWYHDWYKSLRLNVFKGVKLPPWNHLDWAGTGWKVKRDIKWIKNCPLPENEVFMRYR